jgi:hypothetical protein
VRGACVLGVSRCGGGPGLAGDELEHHGHAGPRVGFGADHPVGGGEDAAGQSHAQADGQAVGLAVDVADRFEDAGQASGADVAAGVANAAFQDQAVGGRTHLQGRLDRATAGLAEGAIDEGVEDLQQAGLVHVRSVLGIAVVGGQQGHAAGGGAALPAGIDRIHQVAQAAGMGLEGQDAQVGLMQVDRAAHQGGQVLAGLVDGADAGLGVRREILARQALGEVSHAVKMTQDFAAHALDQHGGRVLRRGRADPAGGHQDQGRADAQIAAVLDDDEAAGQGVRPGGQQMVTIAPGRHARLGDGRLAVHDLGDQAVAVGLGQDHIAGDQAHGLLAIDDGQHAGVGFGGEPGCGVGAIRPRRKGRAAVSKGGKSVHGAGRGGQSDLQHDRLRLRIG